MAAALVISPAPAAATTRTIHWTGSWAAAQMMVAPADALPAPAPGDATVRQLVRLSVGGRHVRLRVSNAFGASPLQIIGVHIARAVTASSSRIEPASDREVTFAGRRSVELPAGAEYDSDPLLMDVPALTTLAVSIHLRELPKSETGHPGSRATSYVARGDELSAPELRSANTTDHWYFLSELDVAPASASLAVLGDSITDGHGVETNTNGRWTDELAERLQASPRTRLLGVLNVGIGGNRLLEDGLGPNAMARLGRDVLARSGVRYMIILEGVNDLGVLTRDKPATPEQHRILVQNILAAYAQMIARAHERGIKIMGATIMPYGGSAYYHPDRANEADRQAINAWIRASGHFDAVIDFDALMRDPRHPDRLRPDVDSGDGLHPSPAGYRAMGRAVPLSLFTGGLN